MKAVPRCARCGRTVAEPVDLAGMKLGAKCARAVRLALIEQPRAHEDAPLVTDPRQQDFFQSPDLFGAHA